VDKWNATLTVDYLWTNKIVGEVFPTTVTPSTWSVWQDYFAMLSMGDMPSIERIAGRPYLNYSLTYSFMLKIMRKHKRVMEMTKDAIGLPPAGVTIPSVSISWRTVLFQVLVREARNELKKARLRKNAPEFLALLQERCQELYHQIERASAGELIVLWTQEIKPLWTEIHPLQDKMNEELERVTRRLKTELTAHLGEEEASALLTTISSAGELASLGPLTGLARLSKGELSREEYLQRYGHRGPHENELAEPRPYEDPEVVDRQLAEFNESPVDVTGLLARRDAESVALWGEIKHKLPPKKAEALGKMIDATAETNTLREATRSELTRLVGLIRTWFLRSGELGGLGDGVFFLTIDETIDLLSGDASSVAHIPARRKLYDKYSALPALPTWIRGRFDPFQWAADPNRRRDVFGAHTPEIALAPRADHVIKGQPGSAGRAEGIVQRIDSPDEGNRLQTGEILVASTTNVGWTPLFPRAAAVVTDIGGSLSHAAIVARELGIPAVVGCGDATTRLNNGDRVLVDGSRGIVQILESSRIVSG
jgi:phosphohistidine swiveling domain-containing protein